MICSCGLPSKQKCKELFDATLAKEFSDFNYVRVRRLTVDTYSLQHPDDYLISPKSFAAHLTGMCCAIEHDNNSVLLRILQHWLDGKKQLDMPALPDNVGTLTILHVEQAKSGAEHMELVHEWATNVWKAYTNYHDLAKSWIEAAKQEFLYK